MAVSIENEYESLRQEILQNKSYIFERPLLIVGAFVASVKQLSESDLAILLPPFLVFILIINFWFTANRLTSTARIVAYISVILESKNATIWIGWESALRKYRMLLTNNYPEDLEEKIKKHYDEYAVPDALMFYPPIYRFHLGIAIFMIIIYMRLIPKNLLSNLDRADYSISLIAMILLSVVLIYYFFVRYPPSKMRNLIERERAIWMILQEENWAVSLPAKVREKVR
jgi:hypothetical protein